MEKDQSLYDYGKCHICGEHIREQQIKQEFWIKGKLVVIENIPAGVCPQCGEKVVKADVGRSIAVLIEVALRSQRIHRGSVVLSYRCG